MYEDAQLTGRKRGNGFCSILCCALAISLPAHAQDFWERTHLVDVRVGSSLSRTAVDLSYGGYELSDGTPVSFEGWYTSSWKDLGITFMTELSDEFGLYWGVGTGERGEKYEIEPSLKLGFLYLLPLSDQAALSVSASRVFGGRLKEETCVADYGAIGGVQTVNCRLAASILPPRKTLDYLADEPPADRTQVSVRFVIRF